MNLVLVWNSLLVAVSSTILSVAFGFFAALWANSLSQRSRRLVTLSAIIALALPPFLVTNCWLELLGQTGAWRNALHLDIYGLGGTIWILSLLLWSIPFLFITAAWNRIQPSHLEADPALTGCGLIRWLLLPAAQNAIIQSGVLTFVLALNNFAVPAILQVKVFPEETWVSFNTKFDYLEALRLGWPMILCPLLLLIVFRSDKVSFGWRSLGLSGALFRRSVGNGLFSAAALISIFILIVSLGIPLAQLAGSARTWREFLPALLAGQAAITYSLLFAALTATAVLLFSFLTWRLRLQEILWIPFFIPGVLLGIAIIWIFNRPTIAAIYQSMLIVVIAYAIRYAGFGWSTISHAMRTIDRNLTDAAQIEGASRSQLFRFTIWPQISTQAAAAWYVTYLLCLWDVETLVLIVPPGEENISLRIFNLLHYGHNTQVNALCLVLLALAILPLVIWSVKSRFSKVAMLAILATSCSVQQSDHVAIQSKLFESVQVIGSRGTALGQLNKPRSVAVDANDNLYVVDMTARVQKFSPDGKFLTSWQITHTEKGKPKGMDRDKNGNVILVEPHYQRVSLFTPDGKLITRWGTQGTNAGELAFPRSVAVNSKGELFITEYSLVERIQHFTVDGKFIDLFGKDGSGPGEFSRAEGIGIDSHDKIYVADSCNHRIQIFSPDEKFLTSYGKAGSGIGELSYPYDIRVDKQGFQFVCEFGNSRIQVFDPNNKPVETLGKAGGAPGDLANPWSIALDSKGNLYVADSQNHRVEKFIRKTTTTKLQAPNTQAPEKLQTSSSKGSQPQPLSLSPRFNAGRAKPATHDLTVSTVYSTSCKTVEAVTCARLTSGAPSLKRGVNEKRESVGVWCLVLLWSLKLGTWSFHS